MKEFILNWLAGVIIILITCFFIIAIPFLLSLIGLPDWVNVVYLFGLCSVFLAFVGMKDN